VNRAKREQKRPLLFLFPLALRSGQSHAGATLVPLIKRDHCAPGRAELRAKGRWSCLAEWMLSCALFVLFRPSANLTSLPPRKAQLITPPKSPLLSRSLSPSRDHCLRNTHRQTGLLSPASWPIYPIIVQMMQHSKRGHFSLGQLRAQVSSCHKTRQIAPQILSLAAAQTPSRESQAEGPPTGLGVFKFNFASRPPLQLRHCTHMAATGAQWPLQQRSAPAGQFLVFAAFAVLAVLAVFAAFLCRERAHDLIHLAPTEFR